MDREKFKAIQNDVKSGKLSAAEVRQNPKALKIAMKVGAIWSLPVRRRSDK